MNLAPLRSRRTVKGRPGAVTISNFTYNSSIDTGLTGLIGRYAYAAGQSNRKMLVLGHAYLGSVADFGTLALTRIASYGFFVVMYDLRGNGNSPGTRDIGGREIHDIWDAVEWAYSNHADKIQPRGCAVMTGYSNGGANTLCAMAKVPDTFAVYNPHFAISKYADWYGETSGANQTTLSAGIGGTPGAVPNNYAARDPRDSIAAVLALDDARKRPGPFLHMFHDVADATVTVHHTTDLQATLTGSEPRFATRITGQGGEPQNERALHGLPGPDSGFAVEGVAEQERYWVPRALRAQAWLMPRRGTVRVRGFLRSRAGFAVWLGVSGAGNPKTDATGGQSQYAIVTYDLDTRTFTVTPQTGAMRVRCEIGGLSQTANVSSATEITVP